MSPALVPVGLHPYASGAYADSLSHLGGVVPVPEWGGFVLSREIPGGGQDAAGTYPIAVLAEDADWAAGLERLRRLRFVSVTLVVGPTHRWQIQDLRRCFQVVNPFKTHYLRRNHLPFAYGKHHRYEVRRALGRMVVGEFALGNHLDDWTALQAKLAWRHNLGSIHAFPRRHFELLGRMSGVTAMGAWMEGTLVSAHLWVSDGRYVHSHLAASSEEGYRARASYAVYDQSIRRFSGAELVNLGGGAGLRDDPEDGLVRFKRGFSNDASPAYLCGAVLDEARYDNLIRQRDGRGNRHFFPAYRAPFSIQACDAEKLHPSTTLLASVPGGSQ